MKFVDQICANTGIRTVVEFNQPKSLFLVTCSKRGITKGDSFIADKRPIHGIGSVDKQTINEVASELAEEILKEQNTRMQA